MVIKINQYFFICLLFYLTHSLLHSALRKNLFFLKTVFSHNCPAWQCKHMKKVSFSGWKSNTVISFFCWNSWPIFIVSSLITDKSETERQVLANREKEKGNEAFQSGNYSEALMYYCRSIELNPQVTAVYNNRALAGTKYF